MHSTYNNIYHTNCTDNVAKWNILSKRFSCTKVNSLLVHFIVCDVCIAHKWSPISLETGEIYNSNDKLWFSEFECMNQFSCFFLRPRQDTDNSDNQFPYYILFGKFWTTQEQITQRHYIQNQYCNARWMIPVIIFHMFLFCFVFENEIYPWPLIYN